MTNAEIAIRQAEFLSALTSLLKTYQASIAIEGECICEDAPFLTIEACGQLITPSNLGRLFDADACLDATEAAINYGVSLA